jgi:hypothetical protein
MMFVAEGHWLFDGDLRARGVSGSVQLGPCPDEEADDEYSTKDADARKRIRAVVENLGHLTTSHDFPAYPKAGHLSDKDSMHQGFEMILIYLPLFGGC